MGRFHGGDIQQKDRRISPDERRGLSGGGNQTLRGPQGPQGRKSRMRLEN